MKKEQVKFEPKIHKDRKKVIDGKIHYQGEVTDSAGTHSFWISKSDYDKKYKAKKKSLKERTGMTKKEREQYAEDCGWTL